MLNESEAGLDVSMRLVLRFTTSGCKLTFNFLKSVCVSSQRCEEATFLRGRYGWLIIDQRTRDGRKLLGSLVTSCLHKHPDASSARPSISECSWHFNRPFFTRFTLVCHIRPNDSHHATPDWRAHPLLFLSLSRISLQELIHCTIHPLYKSFHNVLFYFSLIYTYC